MGSLYVELRRRKVFRVAALYAVVAWVLIQVADTLAPILSLPESASRLVLFVLIILFPVALFLAWAYELTPDGLKSDDGTVAATASGGGFVTALFAGIFLLTGAGLFVYNQPDAPEPIESLTAEEPGPVLDKSIAVLPFTAFSSDPNEQFFADGLSDTLLHKLAQLNEVRVISRTSSFKYRGAQVDVRDVGNELQVATVLEGSVQRNGDQLRIIAQLVNTQDGGHIWSQNFDRRSDDIFAIQDEIADAVTRSLQLSLSPQEQTLLADTGTDSVEAFNRLTLLRERFYAINAFEMAEEEYEQTMDAFAADVDAIIALDTGYADAYRLQANLRNSVAFRSTERSRSTRNLQLAHESLQRAMVLEPTNARNLSDYSELKRREGDETAGELFARMAYALSPSDPEVLESLNLALMDQSKEAPLRLQLSLREAELSPNNEFVNRRLSFALLELGRAEEALAVQLNQLGSADQPQLLANDLVSIQSVVLGRHTDAMRSLVTIRRGLEDQAGEVFNNAWLTMTTKLGLARDAGAGQAQLSPSDEMFLDLSQQFQAGRYADLRVQLQQILAQQTSNSIVSASLAQVCLMLRDYPCARDALIASYPGLESRGYTMPELLGSVGFARGIPLVYVHQQLGEVEAATRLLKALVDYRADRVYDGFFFSRYYGDADLFLLLGDPAQALAIMAGKIELPGVDVVLHCAFCSFDSPLYDSLRQEPEFQRLVAEYERRVAASSVAVQQLIAESDY